MRKCWICNEEAVGADRDGWTVYACRGWFDGQCSGMPVGVVPPPAERQQKMGMSFTHDQAYFEYINSRIRQIWPKKENIQDGRV